MSDVVEDGYLGRAVAEWKHGAVLIGFIVVWGAACLFVSAVVAGAVALPAALVMALIDPEWQIDPYLPHLFGAALLVIAPLFSGQHLPRALRIFGEARA